MSLFWNNFLVKVLTSMTPEIVNGLRHAVKELDESAKKTSNPIDDIFTGLLRGILGDPESK